MGTILKEMRKKEKKIRYSVWHYDHALGFYFNEKWSYDYEWRLDSWLVAWLNTHEYVIWPKFFCLWNIYYDLNINE